MFLCLSVSAGTMIFGALFSGLRLCNSNVGYRGCRQMSKLHDRSSALHLLLHFFFLGGGALWLKDMYKCQLNKVQPKDNNPDFIIQPSMWAEARKLRYICMQGEKQLDICIISLSHVLKTCTSCWEMLGLLITLLTVQLPDNFDECVLY